MNDSDLDSKPIQLTPQQQLNKNAVRGILAHEGLVSSEYAKQLGDQVVAQQIDAEEAIKRLKAHHGIDPAIS